MTDDAHILVVDDDDRIRSLTSRYLSGLGYRISTAEDAAKARRLSDMFDFDLIILDVMMPGEDGFAFLSSLRQSSDIPVLMLTARGDSSDRIDGLQRGADDYLAKPFEPEELALRIAAILRRITVEPPVEDIEMSGLVFQTARGELHNGAKRIRLTEAECQLLTLLARKPGEPVSRQELAASASNGEDRSVDVQVTRLRKKIEPDPRNPIHIQTVRGVGYRLMPD